MFDVNNDWNDVLKNEVKQEYFVKLQNEIDELYKSVTVFPPKDEIFSALKLTSYKDTKVVILGQDPYHEVGQSEGLAFSVKNGVKIPPSLRNIFKEINDDIGASSIDNGSLVPWAKSGVLLLNSVLTVEEGKANSHKNLGWEIFTTAIIKELNKKDGVVFMLWGNDARAKEKYITNPKHIILKAAHPSPLSAYRGFFGCKHFSKANKFLDKPIKW